MPKKQKINLEQVRASLNTLCTKCGYPIPPQEIRRVGFCEVVCPKLGSVLFPVLAPGRLGTDTKSPRVINRGSTDKIN